MTDMVNHPKHYTSHPTGVECIDIIEHMTFNRGAAVKYIWRAGQKHDLIEDLKKAKWFIEREISRIEAQKSRSEEQSSQGRDAPGSQQVFPFEETGSN
jgi:hypothetical protein